MIAHVCTRDRFLIESLSLYIHLDMHVSIDRIAPTFNSINYIYTYVHIYIARESYRDLYSYIALKS